MRVLKFKIKKSLTFEQQLALLLIISLLIHMLIFIGYSMTHRGVFDLFSFLKLSEPPAAQADELEKRIEFEFVETPDDAATPEEPDPTNLLSDKNSRGARRIYPIGQTAGRSLFGGRL